MVDKVEAERRGKPQRKAGKTHPYAAIEHRVIDSQAFASLSFSARSLLLQIARQLNGSNNGHLQATHSYLQPYGFSENTITRAVAELIATGILYRSRAGGYHLGPAKYAVTWLPLTKNTEGLYLTGFKPFAWRDWIMPSDKTPPPNLRTANRKNGEWTDTTPPKFAVVPPPKFEDIELVPHRVSETGQCKPSGTHSQSDDATCAPSHSLTATDDTHLVQINETRHAHPAGSAGGAPMPQAKARLCAVVDREESPDAELHLVRTTTATTCAQSTPQPSAISADTDAAMPALQTPDGPVRKRGGRKPVEIDVPLAMQMLAGGMSVGDVSAYFDCKKSTLYKLIPAPGRTLAQRQQPGLFG